MEKQGLKVKKVTCGLLQELNEMGLVKGTQQEVGAKLLEISLDSEQVRGLCEKIFDEDFSNQDWGEFDLSLLTEGWRRFLKQYHGSIG